MLSLNPVYLEKALAIAENNLSKAKRARNENRPMKMDIGYYQSMVNHFRALVIDYEQRYPPHKPFNPLPPNFDPDINRP